MNFEQLLLEKKTSVNLLSKESGVPRTTILDIVRGRSETKKASGITLYRIAKTLGVPMEQLVELDCPSDIDEDTGKPVDCSYFECSVGENLSRILRNLKNSIYTDNRKKQVYWKDQLIEELTSLRRKDVIGEDSFDYFCEKYLAEEVNND